MEKKPDQEDDIRKTLSVDTTSKKWSFPGRFPLLGIAAALAVFAGSVFWLVRDDAQTFDYKTQSVQQGDLTIKVSATGNIEPTNEVDVSSELSGIVKSVDVDYNDHVKKGQVLARLDTDKLEAQVLQTRATLKAARSKVLQAKATVAESRSALERLNRVRELSGGKIPSKSDLDTADAELKRAVADEASAESSVAQAAATLKVDETNLSKAKIYSPINGIVLERSIEPGQTVAASLSAPVLFTLAEDLSQMELQVDVDEADVGNVKDGQEASFTVDAYPGRKYEARVTQVRYGAQTTDNVVTYKAVLRVDNSDLSLRPGMTATADIVIQKVEKALLVPNAALRFAPPSEGGEAGREKSGSIVSRILPHPPRPKKTSQNNGQAGASVKRIWVLEGGVMKALDVQTGATDGSMTEVKGGGVRPGMELVVSATSREK